MYGNYVVEHLMFSDPERRHETEVTIIQGLKQVLIFCSDYIIT